MSEEVKIKLNKKVIDERKVEIRGKEYQEITYEDGEIVLKNFHPKHKIWVSLRFSKEDDTEVIEKIIKEASKIFTYAKLVRIDTSTNHRVRDIIQNQKNKKQNTLKTTKKNIDWIENY